MLGVFNFDDLCGMVINAIPANDNKKKDFIEKVINEYYHEISTPQKKHLHKLVINHEEYNSEDELVSMLEARLNPNSQKTVYVRFDGVVQPRNCFLYKDNYYTSSKSYITKIFIVQ